MTFSWLLGPVALVVGVGCSTSSSTAPACNANPWACGAGQTCWPTGVASKPFDCLDIPADSGASGSTCLNTPRVPSCAAGLACIQTNPATGGTCAAYCDVNHGCPNGQQCVQDCLGVPSPCDPQYQFSACAGSTTSGDASTD